jgi:hypothetical protein
MINVLSYIFWPNPGNAHYDSPKAMALIIICALMVVGSFVLSQWRKKASAGMRKSSKSWPTASFWFGLIGLVLVVARVEQIQFIAMRLWWILWALFLVLFIGFQVKNYRARHYEVIPTITEDDPRAKYLPKKKKK